MKKRIFAALLCVIMLFGMLRITALAADPVYVAWIGETGYETLGEAVKAAKSGDTIQTTHFTVLTVELQPRGKI